MRVLFDAIPIEEMNTSMTINATAMWLFAMYLALAEERGIDPSALAGTTQNDIVKEYLSRGTYIFGPEASRRLTVDLVCHTVRHVPKWNPINVCSYHLQEAGATPVEEIAYALATAIGILDAVRDSGQVSADEFPEVVGRISFFVNAGIRFVEEMCKLRAFGRAVGAAPRRALRRHRREAAPLPLRRAGELARPHRGAAREQRAAHRARDARRHAVEGRAARARSSCRRGTRRSACPARGTSSGRCASSRCSPSRPTCSSTTTSSPARHVVEAKTAELAEAGRAELQWVLDGGGAFSMIDAMKQRLVQSNAERVRRIEPATSPSSA